MMLKRILNIFGRGKSTSSTGFGFGSEFATPPQYIVQAFNEIVGPISGLEDQEKEAMRNAFVEVSAEGNPRKEEEVCFTFLKDKNWDWPWFNEWNVYFKNSNEWPYLWKELKLDIKEPSFPQNTKESLCLLTVSDMKEILKSKKIKPLPKRREEFEEKLISIVTVDDIKEIIETKILSSREYILERRTKGKIKLLSSTITRFSYTLRDKERFSKVGRMLQRGYKLSLQSSGCAVEDKVAKIESSKGKTPPFFPGDRSHIGLRKARE